MPDEQPQQTKTPVKFWKELSGFEIAAIALMIGFFIYIKSTTALVVNINNGNETRIINNVQNPPHTLLYPPNAFVPKSNVSNTQTFIGIMIFAIVVLMLLAKRVSMQRLATMKEAMDDLSRQLKQLKNITLSDGTTIPITDDIDIKITPQFYAKYKTVGNERKIVRYSFLTMITNKKEGTEHYFRVWYQPWTRYWEGFFETAKSLQETDKCPHCGTEADEKVIIGEDLAKLRDLRKAFGVQR